MIGFANDAFVGNLDQFCDNIVSHHLLQAQFILIKITVYVGNGRGSKQVKGFMFEKPIDLKVGVNHLTMLSSTMGMKVSM